MPWTRRATARPSPTASTSRSPTGRSAATRTGAGQQVGVWQYCLGLRRRPQQLHARVPLHGLPRAQRDVTTFPTILERLLRGEAGRPFVTFYDHASGERTELSMTTYANWVAKTASPAGRRARPRARASDPDRPADPLAGTGVPRRRLDAGLVVTEADDARRRRVRPRDLPPGRARREAAGAGVLPAAARRTFRRPAPAGVHDVGVEVWSPAGRVHPLGPAGRGDAADLGGRRDQPARAVGRRPPPGACSPTAAASSPREPGFPTGIPSFTEPLVRGGSLVLVAHATRERLGDVRRRARSGSASRTGRLASPV